MKIGFSGHPGVGKSTLLKQIDNSFKDIIVTDEPARTAIKLLGIKEEKEHLQKAILSSFISVEMELDKIITRFPNISVVYDRAISDVFIFFYAYKIDKNLIIKLMNNVAEMYKLGVLRKYDIIYVLKNSYEFIERFKDFYMERILNDHQRRVMGDYSKLENYIKLCSEFHNTSIKIISYLQEKSGYSFYNEIFEISTDDFIIDLNYDNVIEILERRNKFIIKDIKENIKEEEQ